MKNVEMQIKGNKLIIEVDLSKSFGASRSGKSKVIGSSEGNISVPGKEKIKLGLNVYSAID